MSARSLLEIAQMLPVAMADAGSRAAELTTMFNSEVSQLVLGGRAIKLGVLQSATATNLCHAYCSLLIVSDSVSRAVERFERSTCPQLKSTCIDIPAEGDGFSDVTSSEFLRPYFAYLHMFDKADQAPPLRNHAPVTTGLFDSPREPDTSAPLHYRFWVERTMSSKKETRLALLAVQDHQQRLSTKLSDILSERFEETLLRGWVSAGSCRFYARPPRDLEPDDRVTRTSKNMDLIHPAVMSVVKDTKIMFSVRQPTF
ncbi:MAG: hypothetical protein KVP17_003090 [Porospora cf. gigantea B]|uniref:uncharacterized protein n=1 Tax=Porospora cf. gigantea B TaxID=2853592 RepID=UPI003571DD37|nr:MAG: hypothetical protein KVP17_003090 [Porospora cf. gigantea B]